jgi:hypothetical protein
LVEVVWPALSGYQLAVENNRAAAKAAAKSVNDPCHLRHSGRAIGRPLRVPSFGSYAHRSESGSGPEDTNIGDSSGSTGIRPEDTNPFAARGCS